MALLLSASRCGQGVGGGEAGRGGGLRYLGRVGRAAEPPHHHQTGCGGPYACLTGGSSCWGSCCPLALHTSPATPTPCSPTAVEELPDKACGRHFHSMYFNVSACFLHNSNWLLHAHCSLKFCCSRQIVTSVARAKSKGTKPASRQLSYSGAVAYEADLEAVA